MTGFPIASSFQLWSTAPYVGSYDPIRFSSMTDLRFSRFDESAEMWNIVSPGITFSGICGTRTCMAYEKNVCCKLSKGGYGKFDVAKDSCDCVCPCCEKPLKILETCSFYNCKWEYTGMVQLPSASEAKLPKKYIKKNGSGLANVKMDILNIIGALTNWRFLEFTVERIPLRELVDR